MRKDDEEEQSDQDEPEPPVLTKIHEEYREFKGDLRGLKSGTTDDVILGLTEPGELKETKKDLKHH